MLRMVLLFVLVSACVAFADTTWVSDSLVSGTWTAEHSPYMIQNNVRVSTGQGLGIGPGVTVYFTGAFYVWADSGSSFDVSGVEGDSVRFTTDTLTYPRWQGIWLSSHETVGISHAVFEYSGAGGPALLTEHGIIRIESCAFRYCSGDVWPSAVWTFGDSVTFTSCVFYGNTRGAVEAHGATNFTDCLFESNRAIWGSCLFGAENTKCTDCIFIGNSGVAIDRNDVGGQMTLTDCQFLDNTNTPGYEPAAIYSEGYIQATRCLFSDNQGFNGGAYYFGGIYPDSSVFDHCVFSHNQAISQGGTYFVGSEKVV
jgi:hypothetical protein